MGNANQRSGSSSTSSTEALSPPRKRAKNSNGNVLLCNFTSLASGRFSGSPKLRNAFRKRKHTQINLLSVEKHWPSYSSSFEPEFPWTSRVSESDFVVSLKLTLSQRKTPQILNALGKGRFATVFRAVRRASVSQQVAIKIQDKTSILKAGAEEHIKNEVCVQKMLGKSKFVAWFMDSWQTSTELFTIMEYVDGQGDLFSLFSEFGQFSEQVTCLYSVQIALGLQFLHDNHIIHRDVKMENIMLDNNLHVKFVDFGFSKHLEPGALTKTICGTLQFLSPEVAGEEPYSYPSDWWSFGITLYVMRTGKYPFPNNFATSHHDLTFEQQTFPETCSNEFKMLMERVLQVDPSKRLSSTDELFEQSFYENVNIKGIENKDVCPFEILKSECNSFERLKMHQAFEEHYNAFDFYFD